MDHGDILAAVIDDDNDQDKDEGCYNDYNHDGDDGGGNETQETKYDDPADEGMILMIVTLNEEGHAC